MHLDVVRARLVRITELVASDGTVLETDPKEIQNKQVGLVFQCCIVSSQLGWIETLQKHAIKHAHICWVVQCT